MFVYGCLCLCVCVCVCLCVYVCVYVCYLVVCDFCEAMLRGSVYIYIFMCVCVCVCVCLSQGNDLKQHCKAHIKRVQI